METAGNWYRVVIGFWLMGMLNNAIFVILNAGAKEIDAGGVGLVYFCNVFPAFVVKSTAAFWFDKFSYWSRVVACSFLMVACLLIVAFAQSLSARLGGIMIGAFASALGEASFLAFSSKFDGRLALTAWSSGTGFAGVFGYMWTLTSTRLVGMSFRESLVTANVLPVAWLATYVWFLRPSPGWQQLSQNETTLSPDPSELVRHSENERSSSDLNGPVPTSCAETSVQHVFLRPHREMSAPWSIRDRLSIIYHLRAFTLPLFFVYVAEYSMQAGTWAAVGFPITDKSSRDNFYQNANTIYQVGVFFSRSSGTFFRISKVQLWVMPVLQVCLLVFFIANGIWHLWWNEWLLCLAFVVGTLGGAVYCHGFILISEQTHPEEQEVALASASVADTFGIVAANILGIMIQGCLYGVNNITDGGKPPLFTCGYTFES